MKRAFALLCLHIALSLPFVGLVIGYQSVIVAVVDDEIPWIVAIDITRETSQWLAGKGGCMTTCNTYHADARTHIHTHIYTLHRLTLTICPVVLTPKSISNPHVSSSPLSRN
jgi:hypothetical protein